MILQTIRPASTEDWPAIASLLARYDLPIDGAQIHLETFFLAVDADDALLGVAGLEHYGSVGLLRSVAVAEQGKGVGEALIRHVLKIAPAHGIEQIVLLTATAADYFPRFGFRRIERTEAPPAAHESAEFQGACPASAVVMLLDLRTSAFVKDDDAAHHLP